MRYTFPKLKNWQDFEILCKDIMSENLSVNFIQAGRLGQKQKGIDFYGLDLNHKYIAIQCKNSNKLTIGQIKKDIEKIEELEVPISTIYFMTASNRNFYLQEQITKITTFPLKIEIIFWEDIEELLNVYPIIAHKYYPYYNKQDLQKFFDGRENFFRLYAKDNNLKNLWLISNEYNIKIEVQNDDISIRYNNDTYDRRYIYDKYITLIELPFNQLYFFIQELYRDESITEFTTSISQQWGIEINVGLETVIYNGSYYIENNILYDDLKQKIDPITSKYLFNIINHMKYIHNIITQEVIT